MNRLDYPRKFVLISLVFLVPLALVCYFFDSEIRRAIGTAREEMLGTAELRALRRLLEHLPEAELLARDVARGRVAARPDLVAKRSEVDADLRACEAFREGGGDATDAGLQVLAENWRFLREEGLRLPEADRDALHAKLMTGVQARIARTGDRSTLILDPDLDSYYLMDAILLRLPENVDLLARLRLLGRDLAARGRVEAEERANLIALAGLVRSNNERMRHGVAGVAFRNTRSERLKLDLQPPLQESLAATAETLRLVEAELIDAAQVRLDPAAFEAAATKTLDRNFHLWDRAADELDALLAARIRRFGARRLLVAGLAAAALATVAYLFLAFYSSVMRTVTSFEEASRRMLDGDLSGSVRLETRDELGQVAVSFDAIARRLRSEWQQAREESARAHEAGELLRQAEEKYRSIFENAIEGIFQMAPDGTYLSANPALRRLYGTAEATGGAEPGAQGRSGEAPGRRDVDPARRIEFLERVAAEGRVTDFEIQVRRADGELGWVSESAHAVRDREGRLLYVEGAAIDITERKRSDERLHQALALVKLLQVVAVAANEAETVEQALRVGVDQVCAYMGWPIGHAYLVERPDGEARLVPTPIWFLRDPERFQTFREGSDALPLAAGVGLAGRVLDSGSPLWLRDVARDEGFRRAGLAREAGLGAGLGLPVLAGGEVVAVLEFFDTRATDLERERLETMLHVAGQLGRVFERRRAAADLERSRREQLLAKDQLLSHVSHEIRTPLNAIYQFVTILLDGLAGELAPEQREHLEIALRNVNQLRAMIGDLLDATRSESAKLTIAPREVAVADVVGEIVRTLRSPAAEKEVALDSEVPADLPGVLADPARLRQVLTNLVQNAVKFTPPGGRVHVSAARMAYAPAFLRLAVHDTGCGIPRDRQAQLFQRLYQVNQEDASSRKGLGLGLYLCREMITRMGGQIGLESEPGKGSVFFFTLPVHGGATQDEGRL